MYCGIWCRSEWATSVTLNSLCSELYHHGTPQPISATATTSNIKSPCQFPIFLACAGISYCPMCGKHTSDSDLSVRIAQDNFLVCVFSAKAKRNMGELAQSTHTTLSKRFYSVQTLYQNPELRAKLSTGRIAGVCAGWVAHFLRYTVYDLFAAPMFLVPVMLNRYLVVSTVGNRWMRATKTQKTGRTEAIQNRIHRDQFLCVVICITAADV